MQSGISGKSSSLHLRPNQANRPPPAPASQELHDAFNTLVSTPSHRGLLAGIQNEQLVPLKPLPSSTPDFHADLSAALTPHLTPTDAAYILLRRHADAPDGFVCVTYVPDAANVRQKMLFASSRLTLVRELGTERFRETLFATTPEELGPEGWRRHEAHGELAAPLTEEERTLQGVKEAEAEESRGTGARSSHVSSGVSFPLSDEALAALRGLAGETEGHNLVQLKIDPTTETIHLASTSTTPASALPTTISTTEPRYSFFRYAHTHDAQPLAPVVFIYTCPTASRIKDRMLYASSRAGVLAAAQADAGVLVERKMEAGHPEDVGEEAIHEELHPRVEAKSAFSRPKRPGRR